MAYLFKIVGNKVKPTPECLLVSPFKNIWNKDKTKDKKEAINSFTYIEFSSSLLKTNIYSDIAKSRRGKKIIKELMPSFKPDVLTTQGIKFIEDFQNTHILIRSYNNDLEHLEKLETYLGTINFVETLENGTPKYDITKFMKTINEKNILVLKLHEIKKKIEVLLQEEIKTKGNKAIGIFAQKDTIERIRNER